MSSWGICPWLLHKNYGNHFIKICISFSNLTCILLMHHTIRYLLIWEITVLVSHLKKEKNWILKSNICNQYANFLNKYHFVFFYHENIFNLKQILLIESWMFTIKFLGYHLGWLLQNCRTKRYCGLCFDWPGTLLIKTNHSKRRQLTISNTFISATEIDNNLNWMRRRRQAVFHLSYMICSFYMI